MNHEMLVERVALIPDKVKGEEWSAQPTKRSSESFRMTNALSLGEGPAEVARRAG